MSHPAAVRIRPARGWASLGLRQLWAFRELLFFLALRDIKAKYAQSVLGVGWAILNPLMQALLFTVVFGELAQLDSDGTPYLLFSFTAMVVWTYFSGVLTDATNSLIRNREMIGKVYFPRLILPLTSIIGKGVDFGVALAVLFPLLFAYGYYPGWHVLMFLPLLLILLMTAAGAGAFLAALAVQYRDVQYAMSTLIRLLMYAAPVVYSVDLIPESWRWLYACNPLVGVIEGARAIFLQSRPFPWAWVAIGGAVSLGVCLLGGLYFRRMERHFADIA